MRITFIGTGDAFGSGGRLNTCFHVETRATRFLVDCGATSMPALKRLGIERNAIDTILVTHFHADHFGGIPYFVLDAQLYAKRSRPLTIAGPRGLKDWYVRALETAFPGSSATRQKFEVALVELPSHQTTDLEGIAVTPAEVCHGPDGTGPYFAYRIEADGKALAYTGDTEWTDALVPIAKDADLLIAEALFRDRAVRYHLNLASLEANLPRMTPRRLMLTHMSDDMLSQIDAIGFDTAEDGTVVTL